MADFALLESPKLISREIWMTEKSWFLHNVKFHLKKHKVDDKLQDENGSICKQVRKSDNIMQCGPQSVSVMWLCI